MGAACGRALAAVSLCLYGIYAASALPQALAQQHLPHAALYVETGYFYARGIRTAFVFLYHGHRFELSVSAAL